ncbi:MAG: GNAT family N-acetyltransferase [Phycisphaerales bacterium]|nr:MAG: GNAT family N-acetyltransferase [Phycisphaerales bacterium]
MHDARFFPFTALPRPGGSLAFPSVPQITAQRLIVRVRPWGAGDDALAATGVLHRAYRPQVEAGLRPLAGRQCADTTARRLQNATPILAEGLLPEPSPHRRTPRPVSAHATAAEPPPATRLAGVILLDELEEAAFPPLFKEFGVAHFSMFAVEPELQGLGIGARLLEEVERRATQSGRATLACSMAGPDTALRDWYLRRGYTVRATWQWPYTNYESLILAKDLA